MAGSLTRPDYNSTFSLLAYLYLATYRGHSALATVLNTLIIGTVGFLLADIFSILVQKNSETVALVGIILIGIEIAIKIFMIILLAFWKFRGEKANSTEQTQKREDSE